MNFKHEECRAAGREDVLPKPRSLMRILNQWFPAAPGQPTPPPPPQPPFNEAEFLERLMGDRALAAQVLDTFLRSMPAQLAALSLAVERGNTAAAAEQAHRIKGSAGMFGGSGLGELASDIEREALAGAAAPLKTLTREMDEHFVRFRQAAEDYLTHNAPRS